jgi:hypothetical protein
MTAVVLYFAIPGIGYHDSARWTAEAHQPRECAPPLTVSLLARHGFSSLSRCSNR